MSTSLRCFLLGVGTLVGVSLLTWAMTTTFSVWTREQGQVVAVYLAPPAAAPPAALQPREPTEPAPAVSSDLLAPDLSAERAAPQVVSVSNPTWIRRPASLVRYYPASALMDGVAGDVELDCSVEFDGSLLCVVLSETPPDAGFGEAALAIAEEYRMAPLLAEGLPARGRLRMTIPFRANVASRGG